MREAHLAPVRYGGGEAFGDGVDFLLQQAVGFASSENVALGYFAAIGIARGAPTDGCYGPAVERIGVGGKMAALKLFNKFYGRCVILLFAGLTPGFEPGLVAAQDVGVGFID